MTQTAALAGQVTITAAEEPLTIRRPAALAPGLAWLGAILDEPADPAMDRAAVLAAGPPSTPASWTSRSSAAPSASATSG